MHKDAPATSASQSGVSLFRQIVRSKKWKRPLFVGALLGMAVVVLDLAAFANEWRLGHWFDAIDTPVAVLMESVQHNFDSLDDLGPEASTFYSLVACAVYWMLIGLLAAAAYCFVRAGGIQRIRRDQASRRALIFGTGSGIFLGGANFLAMLNQVDMLTRCFDFLDRPGVALAEAALDRSGLVQFVPQNPAGQGICLFVATMAYWVIIGFLPAMLFCVVRVLRMRNDVAEAEVSAEALPAK